MLSISLREILRNYAETIKNIVIQDDHVVKKYQILSFYKLNIHII